jgi:proteasome lid subunit RPN8/RPN11
VTPPDQPKVLIAERAAADLRCRARKAHPNETGGILLGVRTAGRPWIMQAIEIPTPDRGRSHYRLPAGTTTAAVRSARNEDPRLGYLGEWHSHPADVGPSPTDRATMRRLALRSPRTGIVLIVVRHGIDGHRLDVHEMTLPFLRSRGSVTTGDLPPLQN